MAGVADSQLVPLLFSGPAFYWTNPLNRAVVHPWSGPDGPNPAVAARANGAVPIDQITIVIANYGQTGGGISIF